jgi:hypothetical protein
MDMRLTPRQKFSPAKKGQRGGPRPGSGRPPGSRNLLPKKQGNGGATVEEQLKEARRIIGEQAKEIELLHLELNLGGPFSGDSKDLLTAVMRGEYHASPQQIYAARAILDREYPPAIAVGPEVTPADFVPLEHPEYLAAMRAITTPPRRNPKAPIDKIPRSPLLALVVEGRVDDEPRDCGEIGGGSATPGGGGAFSCRL